MQEATSRVRPLEARRRWARSRAQRTLQSKRRPCVLEMGVPGRLVGCPGMYMAGAVSEGRGASEKEQMMSVWMPGWAVRGTS